MKHQQGAAHQKLSQASTDLSWDGNSSHPIFTGSTNTPQSLSLLDLAMANRNVVTML